MIEKKRIRNLDNYLFGIPEDGTFYIGVSINDTSEQRMLRTGFSKPFEEGMTVLPKAIGPVSRFNARGGVFVHRDLPKEHCTRQATIFDWHGYECTVTIPYERYPRSEIVAPSIELTLIMRNDAIFVLSPFLQRNADNAKKNTHIVNLFLELFGKCEILKDDLSPIMANIPIKRLNWNVLPKGEYLWEQAGPIIRQIIDGSKRMKARIFEYRAEYISNFKPTQLMIGESGFSGYLIFEFQNKGLYVLENLSYGNATYILDKDWETISQMSKAEIVSQSLHRARIIHQKGWEQIIDSHLR